MKQPLLAAGRDADVHALDDERVLRRYRDGGDVTAEAAVMRHLHTLGFPVPRVHRAEGAELELTRVSGLTLTEAYVTGAVDVRSTARILADLHPENVLLGPAGPVLIDWRHTDEGPPELDVAMTAVILAETGGVRLLDEAVGRRDRLGPLPPVRLAEAAALVRTVGAR